MTSAHGERNNGHVLVKRRCSLKLRRPKVLYDRVHYISIERAFAAAEKQSELQIFHDQYFNHHNVSFICN